MRTAAESNWSSTAWTASLTDARRKLYRRRELKQCWRSAAGEGWKGAVAELGRRRVRLLIIISRCALPECAVALPLSTHSSILRVH